MKKLLLILILVTSSLVISYSIKQNDTDIYYSIENTGFYGVYVTSMPFWTFWNYPKALKMLADKTQKTSKYIQSIIDLKMPLFLREIIKKPNS